MPEASKTTTAEVHRLPTNPYAGIRLPSGQIQTVGKMEVDGLIVLEFLEVEIKEQAAAELQAIIQKAIDRSQWKQAWVQPAAKAIRARVIFRDQLRDGLTVDKEEGEDWINIVFLTGSLNPEAAKQLEDIIQESIDSGVWVRQWDPSSGE